ARADRRVAHRPRRHDEGPRQQRRVERAELELRRRPPRHDRCRHPATRRSRPHPRAGADRRRTRTGVARLVSRAKKPRTESGGSGRGARKVLAVALTLAAAGGLVWGVARLGELARSGVGPRDRYAVRFADIQCDAPPGLDRPTFLSEVRYVANLPEAIQAL